MTDLRDCEPCSSEPNQYEEDWICSLIEWLEAVTCIKWIGAYSNSDTPTGQYGTVDLESFRPTALPERENGKHADTDVCVTIRVKINADVQLTVFGEQQMPCEVGTKRRTSGDVLNRVLDAYHGIGRLKQKLNCSGVTIEDYGRVFSRSEIVKDQYQRNSVVNIELCIIRRTSFAETMIDGYCLDVGTIK